MWRRKRSVFPIVVPNNLKQFGTNLGTFFIFSLILLVKFFISFCEKKTLLTQWKRHWNFWNLELCTFIYKYLLLIESLGRYDKLLHTQWLEIIFLTFMNSGTPRWSCQEAFWLALAFRLQIDVFTFIVICPISMSTLIPFRRNCFSYKIAF